MPDLPVEPASPGRYPAEMGSRVAVLEQIARETTASLARLERGMDTQRAELRAFQERMERRMDMLGAEHRSDFRWLSGLMLAGFTTLLGAFSAMLGAMAHGFHWL